MRQPLRIPATKEGPASTRKTDAGTTEADDCCRDSTLLSTEGVARATVHELNNLIGIIIGNLDIVVARSSVRSEEKELLGYAISAALRGADLIQGLLANAHSRTASPGTIEPDEPEARIGEVAHHTGNRGKTILVVDDSAFLRQVVVHQLAELGYRLHEAANGTEAISILEHEAVDLLFTDIVMPEGMSGYDLAQTALARWPALKLVLTSGAESLITGNRNERLANARFLSKPSRPSDLANAIRNAFET